MEVKPFKIKVTPQQSLIVQEKMMEFGYKWHHNPNGLVEINDTIYLNVGYPKPFEFSWCTLNYPYFEYVEKITFEQFKEMYMKDNELKITKEKVLEASKSCPEAKNVLKKMFPEVFEDDKYFDLEDIETTTKDSGTLLLCTRTYGEFAYKALCLVEKGMEWKLIRDNYGILCLVPTKK